MINLKNLRSIFFFTLFLLIMICGLSVTTKAQILPDSCPFELKDSKNTKDIEKLAKCLIRRVLEGGHLAPAPAELPAPFRQIIGKNTDISIERLTQYLREKDIKDEEIGGAVKRNLEKTLFFVVHDTSTPNLRDKNFPVRTKPDGTKEQVINTKDWSYNNLNFWLRQSVPTHLFVNRLGDSITKNDFSVQNALATKYELAKLTATPCKKRPDLCEKNWQQKVKERSGLFVHIELIQPRHCLKLVPGCKGDRIAPIPGFTEEQIRRLALLYMVASIRRGIWLIPAFHDPIDAGRKDGHDDPQNFEMSVWTRELQNLLDQLRVNNPSNSISTNSAVENSFNFPEPQNLSNAKTFWATHYFVPVVNSVSNGEPLLDAGGNKLGPILSKLDWCKAALEGTITVKDDNRVATTYNFAARAATLQVNCSHIRDEEIRRKIGRNRFALSKGKYGEGVQSMILVPYRTIAVDPSVISFGSVVYIPEARGKEIVLPSGQKVKHDGYFYAADAGSGIKRNHIDVFCGLFEGNCFPNFIKSKETGTFRAFLINNDEIKSILKKEHTRN